MAADEVAPVRAVWRLGDYHRFAREQLWGVGPVISIYESLRTEPDRAARLDSEFQDFAERPNRGTPDGPAAYPYEYVVIVVAAMRPADEIERIARENGLVPRASKNVGPAWQVVVYRRT